MKRIVLLGSVLVVIIAVAVLLSSRKADSSSSFDEYEGDFAVENIDDVGRIVLTKGREYSVDLKRTSDGWILNDKYVARMGSVEPLLDCIRLISIKYIPPKKAEEHILWDIAATGIQVDVYDRSGDLLKSYFVAGANLDGSGTHALMNGAKQPFVVYMPTTHGSIRPRLELTIDDWRDRHFIPFESDDIESVDVEYPSQKSQSFRITRKGDDWAVAPKYSGLREYRGDYREGSIETYLYSITNLACESYKNTYPFMDSVRTLTPIHTVSVKLKDREDEVKIDAYPQGKPVASEYTGPIHWLFFDVQPGDFVGAQYHVVSGVFKGYDFFLDGPDQEIVF